MEDDAFDRVHFVYLVVGATRWWHLLWCTCCGLPLPDKLPAGVSDEDKPDLTGRAPQQVSSLRLQSGLRDLRQPSEDAQTEYERARVICVVQRCSATCRNRSFWLSTVQVCTCKAAHFFIFMSDFSAPPLHPLRAPLNER